MNQMELFNHHLNHSLKGDDDFDFNFLNNVNQIIEETICKVKKRNRVCIIGAGKCREFSLSIFFGSFEEVNVTDVDITSVKESIDATPKLKLRRIEYTGFEQNRVFQIFKNEISKTMDPILVKRIIMGKLREVETYLFLEDEFESFDLVYVSPIYSQLVYQQVLQECEILREDGYPKHILKEIENIFLQEMIRIIDRFNKNLISLLTENGTIIVLSDIFELHSESDFFSKVNQSINNEEEMDLLYEGYVKQYGMGLGDYGLYNLDETLTEVRSKWLIWKFTAERSFLIKMKVYKKNDFKGGVL